VEGTAAARALQRVSETGALGSRYVDTTKLFGGYGSVECEGAVKQPNSPWYRRRAGCNVESSDQIWEIPSDFTSSKPPKSFIQFNPCSKKSWNFPAVQCRLRAAAVVRARRRERRRHLHVSAHHSGDRRGTGLQISGNASFQIRRKSRRSYRHGARMDRRAERSHGWRKVHRQLRTESLCRCGQGTRPVCVKMQELPNVVEFGPGGSGCPTASATPEHEGERALRSRKWPPATKSHCPRRSRRPMR